MSIVESHGDIVENCGIGLRGYKESHNSFAENQQPGNHNNSDISASLQLLSSVNIDTDRNSA